MDNRDKEPVIRQHCDREGREWWLAHDSECNRAVYLSSEAEAHIWLDQRRPF